MSFIVGFCRINVPSCFQHIRLVYFFDYELLLPKIPDLIPHYPCPPQKLREAMKRPCCSQVAMIDIDSIVVLMYKLFSAMVPYSLFYEGTPKQAP